MAFRRKSHQLSVSQQFDVAALTSLLASGDAYMIGAIRQQILSGVQQANQFAALHRVVSGVPILTATIATHDLAAQCYNTCRSHGIIGDDVDMLICAVAIERMIPLWSHDNDFASYAKSLAITPFVP